MSSKGKSKKKSNAIPKSSSSVAKKTDEIEDMSTIQNVVFGVDLRKSGDHEDDSATITPPFKFAILALICIMSFGIRLFAVVRYESVIHEFDPYFNYRATEVKFYFDFCQKESFFFSSAIFDLLPNFVS